MPDLVTEATAMYELAQADAVYARQVWVDAGSPLMMDAGHGGVHPLRKALVEADDRVARRAKDVAALTLRRAQRGRPVGAASAEDRVDAPAPVRLKAVP